MMNTSASCPDFGKVALNNSATVVRRAAAKTPAITADRRQLGNPRHLD
jgi:hypothetical protein